MTRRKETTKLRSGAGLRAREGGSARAKTTFWPLLVACALSACDQGSQVNPSKFAVPKPTDLINAPTALAAAPPDAARSASGLLSTVLVKGTGTEHPTDWHKVVVLYSARTEDGRVLKETSKDLNGKKILNPEFFLLRGAAPGLREGIKLMVVGEQRRFWLPPALAREGKPTDPTATVVYDLQLMAIEQMPAPDSAPEDLLVAPADAEKLPSGLASRVLKAGTGDVRAGLKDFVRARMSVWMPDGTFLVSNADPSVEAAIIQVEKAPMKGLVEGLTLMVVGEKRQFWIPAALGYTNPGEPSGPMFVEAELAELATPKPPPDLATVPKLGEKLPSGTVTLVARAGTGTVHPTDDNMVRVLFNLWSPEGKLMETTLSDGGHLTLKVGAMRPEWRDVVKKMVVGEVRRNWVTSSGNDPSLLLPKGMVILEIELLKIVN